jgi:beta-galactosidase
MFRMTALLAVLALMRFSLRAADDWKVIPFTTSNSVRLEISSSPGAKGLDFSATIRPVTLGSNLWHGALETSGTTGTLVASISGLNARTWSPAHPVLYDLIVTGKDKNDHVTEKKVRFGFRSFESQNGHFLLNGKPIFLRGLAINPPGRTVPTATGESPEFARAYVSFLRSQNFNMIRMTHDSQAWFDACDELGMMVYQGQYGSPLESDPGKKRPPAELNASVESYKALFRTYSRHPSIMIYVLSNELPTSGTRGKAFHEFLSKAHRELKAWDDTHLYIGNAGYGEGREGDVCDVHRYWGWYYNSFLTYYNLRDPYLYNHLGEGWREAAYDEDAGDVAAKNAAKKPVAPTPASASHIRQDQLQPLTFSECVGNFTGPLGEYNIITRKQLGAQLNWTGHSAHQREDALEYQSFMAEQAAESFRRLRPINPRLSGLMPFTILFYNWSGITNFEQMKAKPVAAAMARAYQPILLSWELWTPQVYAGTAIHPVAHIINDSDEMTGLVDAHLEYELKDSKGNVVLRKELPVGNLPYYETHSERLTLDLPRELITGVYHLNGEIRSSGQAISRNSTEIFIAGADWKETREGLPGKALALYDPRAQTAAAFTKLGISFSSLPDLQHLPDPATSIVIGEDDSVQNLNAGALKDFIAKGGRVICLRQDTESGNLNWLPERATFFHQSPNSLTYPPAARPFAANMHINPERAGHAIFKGLERRHFYSWSDYTSWDQTKPGFPAIYPVTSGFKLEQPASLARTAILADYDRGLEGVALCEMFSGKGSVLLCAFDLVHRVGLDPIADRLLLNLIDYSQTTNGHQIHPEIIAPIEWGNYASERGLINGPQYGMVVNADWVVPETNPSARPLTQEQGAWNTRPGDQFVPHGRRLLGPYGYSTGSSLKDLQPGSGTASGFFWAQVPAGKRKAVTIVSNPSEANAKIVVTVGDQVGEPAVSIPSQQTATVTTPLPIGTTNVCVHFSGSKSLVLLKTSFE